MFRAEFSQPDALGTTALDIGTQQLSTSVPIGNGQILSWKRYPGDRPPPSGFDALFFGGEPLRVEESTGEARFALLSDWGFRYRASVFCGRDQELEFRRVTPDGTLLVERYGFDGQCFFFFNGARVFADPVSFVQIVGPGSGTQCNDARLGTWAFDVFHTAADGTVTFADFSDSTVTDDPALVRDVRVDLFATAVSLHPALPDESSLRFGGVVEGELGFVEDPVPGETGTVRASLSNPRCPVGKGIPVEMGFEFLAGSGAHLHHLTGSTPVLTAVGLGAEDVATVVPTNVRSASFDAATGTLSGTTNDGGSLVGEVTAGEVAGQVQVTVEVPGAVITNSPPAVLLIDVEVPGLVSIVPILGLFEVIPNANPSVHSDASFVKPSVGPHIAGLAQAVQNAFGGQSATFPYYTHQWQMRIGAASLETGGLLDQNANFNFPESFHRTGRDIDISLAFRDVLGVRLVYGRMTRGQLMQALDNYVRNNGGSFSIEPQGPGDGLVHVRFP